jgi:hypothetical protein
MRILSVRHTFEADHSSSTYEFFALDKLTPEQRAAVQELTGESPRRHLRFHHGGDWDLSPDLTDRLLTLGYDFMVSESYDWWSVYLSLPHEPGNGFDLRVVGERMILYFGMQLDYSAVYDAFGEDVFEGLADLFEAVRNELLAGDLSAVRATYQTYGDYGEGEPEPVRMSTSEPLSKSGEKLLNIMENY